MAYFYSKKRKQYIQKHSQNKHLIKHFSFFRFIFTQFVDFAFIRVQMPITITKSFYVLNNTAWSVL